MRAGAVALLLAAVLFPSCAAAQCVQVSPDICVTAKRYDAPLNEQPFYGFAAKTPEMLAADERFVAEAVKAGKERVYLHALARGQEAFLRQDFAEAARRFNQAYLLERRDSRVYHGFAMIAQFRFKDLAFAEELFKLAARLPNGSPSLNGDFGRMLMMAKRPVDARPLLERAIKDLPDSALYWNDLAFARLLTDDRDGACDASTQALRLSPPQFIANGLNFLRSKLDCR